METITINLKSIVIPRPNRQKIGEAELAELAATIKERGLLQPILVRPSPSKKTKSYELIAGERRLKGIEQLGLEEIDAHVLDVSANEAAEIRLIENLQRVELSPWEEAEQLAGLCEGGGRIEDIAVRVGRSPKWVAERLAFGRLIPELKQHVIEQNWPLGHLPALARVPPDAQAEVLAEIRANQGLTEDEAKSYAVYDWMGSGNGTFEPEVPSLRELERFLDERRHRMSAATWKLDDAELLPKAGACLHCPKRSSAQHLLFPELGSGKEDTCLDARCWTAKKAALVHVNISKLQEQGKTPVLLKDYSRIEPEVEQVVGPAKIERANDFEKCKKSDPQAQPAVFVNGEKTGEVEYVKPAPWRQERYEQENGNGKAERAVDPETGEREGPSTKERQAMLLQKRKCRAAELWKGKLEGFKPKFTGMLDWLVIFFGTIERREHRSDRAWEDFAKAKAKLNEAGWEQLWPVFETRLRRLGSMEQDADGLWKEASQQAKALGLTGILEFCWKDAVIDVPQTKALQEAGAADQVEMPK